MSPTQLTAKEVSTMLLAQVKVSFANSSIKAW
jgi:hypothetical protein